MAFSYDLFTRAFLMKINEYEFYKMLKEERESVVDHYMKAALSEFDKICKYDFLKNDDVETRTFNIEIPDEEIDEIVDIVSGGMVVHWLKPFVYSQELLQNVLNTKDFTTYSPSELLLRVGNAHKEAKKDFTQMMREYSFNHGAIGSLHI